MVKVQDLVFVLADINGYAEYTSNLSSIDVSHFMSGYYDIAEILVSDKGGRLVKGIGGAVFFVFPIDMLPTLEHKLDEIQHELNAWVSGQNGLCVNVYAHCGEGEIAPTEWYDLFGSEADELFHMRGDGLVYSDALRLAMDDQDAKLSPA